MNAKQSSADGHSAKRPDADPAQEALDVRIRELEAKKNQLEAELAEVQNQTSQPAGSTAGTKRSPKAVRAVAQSSPAATAKTKGSSTTSKPNPQPTQSKQQQGQSRSAAVLPPPEDAHDEEPPEESSSWWSNSRQIPAWAISSMVHLIIFLVLGLLTIAVPATAKFAIIVASEDGNEPLEQMAEVDLSEDLENMEDLSPALDSPQVNQSEVSELALAKNLYDASDIGPQVIENDSVSQINAIFSEDGTAMESLTAKVGKMTASFFGSKAKGRRFVFVVDNSNSMGRGRFHTAIDELVKTVEAMEPDQYFYVIFFSDTAYPLFWPAPVNQLVPATDKNKQRLHQWLYTVELCLHTRGANAMQMALSLRPDAIYILGDGAFTDNTTQRLITPHQRPTPIFTLGMQVPAKGKAQLTQIANANHGTYRLVSVAPAAVQAAKQAPFKKNNVRGPIWGVTLPLRKKKK